MRFPRIQIPRTVLLFLFGALVGSFTTLKFTSFRTTAPDDGDAAGEVQGVTTIPEDGEPEETPAAEDTVELLEEKPAGGEMRVIDGDTIRLANGEKVRYIGINTPELGAGGKDECLATAARAANARLVEGKKLKLEKDVSETDTYRRSLRYVWVDEVFVNETLVAQGLARAVAYPPDVRYAKVFAQAEERARELKLGMWGSLCAGVAPAKPVKTVAPEPSGAPTLLPKSSTCNTKGNISANGEKIYHIPGCKSYTKTVIDENKGERWFCEEGEAKDAGWRKAQDCP